MTESEQALINRVQAAEYLLTRILSDLLARARSRRLDSIIGSS